MLQVLAVKSGVQEQLIIFFILGLPAESNLILTKTSRPGFSISWIGTTI